MLSQFRLGDNLIRVQHQILKCLVLVGGQIHASAVNTDAFGTGIELDGSRGDDRAGEASGAAHQGIEARKNFFHAKRFYDVIIGACIKATDFILPITARCKNQYWIALPRLTHLANQADAIQFWQAKINDGGVVIIFDGQVNACASVPGIIDDKSGLLQTQFKLLPQQAGIFYNQYPHAHSLLMAPVALST